MGNRPNPHWLHPELSVHDGEPVEAKRAVRDLKANTRSIGYNSLECLLYIGNHSPECWFDYL